MLAEFLHNLVHIFVDMAPYMMLSMLFVGIINTYIKPRYVAKSLGTENTASVVKAGVLGIPLLLCSCGVVPTALELKRRGASNGAVVSFLTSTPQTGVDSIIATWGLLGPFMAIYRPIAAFISGIVGGIATNVWGKTGSNPVAEEDDDTCPVCHSDECHHYHHHHHHHHQEGKKGLKNVILYPFGSFLEDISVHFLVGIILAAVISTFVPYDSLSQYGISSGLPAILIMLVISLPLYICSISSIPIALTLLASGISPGAAFVFLFAGPATNVASIALMIKELGKRITAIFVASVAVMAVLFGLLYDWLFTLMPVEITQLIHNGDVHIEHGQGWLAYLLAAVFAVLLLRSLISRVITAVKNSSHHREHHHEHEHYAHHQD